MLGFSGQLKKLVDRGKQLYLTEPGHFVTQIDMFRLNN